MENKNLHEIFSSPSHEKVTFVRGKKKKTNSNFAFACFKKGKFLNLTLFFYNELLQMCYISL